MKQKLLDYEKIKAFVASPKAIVLAFLWGFSEATFFFVVPDVFFIFTAIFSPFFGLIHGLVSILGTALGGAIMYKLSVFFPQAMNNFLLHIPGINNNMIIAVVHNLDNLGLKSLFIAPFSGVPYKIYAVSAGMANLNFIYFIILTIPSRLSRIIILSFVAAVIGRILQKFVVRNSQKITVLYILFWLGFYLFYAMYISRRY